MNKHPRGTCEWCGRENTLIEYKNGMRLCSKHYKQLKRYGKLLDQNPRTSFDMNEIRTDGDISYVDIYDKDCNVIATAIIDTKNIDKVKDIKWKYSHGYASNTPKKNSGKPCQHMHRIIAGVTDPDLFVDHKNHNKLDNREENLRIATKSTNAMNMNSRGVYFNGTRYLPHIKIHQKRVDLGSYYKENDAVYARWYAELLIFRSFQITRDWKSLGITEYEKRFIRNEVREKISRKYTKDEYKIPAIFISSSDYYKRLNTDSFAVFTVDPKEVIPDWASKYYHFNLLSPDYDKYVQWIEGDSSKSDEKFIKYYGTTILGQNDPDDILMRLNQLSDSKPILLISDRKEDVVDILEMIKFWLNTYDEDTCIDIENLNENDIAILHDYGVTM